MKYSIRPQEIFLLERYISLEYLGRLRDTWGRMIAHLELCLARFEQDWPANYRARQLPEQPDIVWRGRILPNFKDTFRGLCNGYIALAHGDIDGLRFANGPLCDFRGQTDFWVDWMSRSDLNTYSELINSAVEMASAICTAEGAYWNPLELTERAEQIEELYFLSNCPTYRVNLSISVETGANVTQWGIYVPDVDNSGAQFLNTKYEVAPEATIFVEMEDLLHPTTGEKYGEQAVYCTRPCTWYLVERICEILPGMPPSITPTA